MRFEISIRDGGYVPSTEGIPPNDPYPVWFVADDGWVYPITSVVAFKQLEDE